MRMFARILLAGVGTLAVATPAMAQTADASVDTSAEAQDALPPDAIIVTAQRRAENLQDVPIAVSAFSEDALEASRLDSAANLALQVPNLNYSAQLYGSSNFSIRGIGYTLVTTAGDQGVGVAENYAPIDRARITDAEFFDTERVEVLRGPQGTLYGRNATGGVINIITRKPDLGTFGGSVTGEYGNYDLRRIKGAVNISGNDYVGLRLAGIMTKRDGTQLNTFTGNEIDSRDFWATRATLLVEPSDDVRITGMWEHFEAEDSRNGVRTACLNDPGPESVGGVPVANIDARNFLSEGCIQTSVYAPGVLAQNNNSYSTLSGQLVALLGVGLPFNFVDGDANRGNVQPDELRQMALASDPFTDIKNDNWQAAVELDLSDTMMLSSITNLNIDRTIQGGGLTPASQTFNSTPFTPDGLFRDPQLGVTDRLRVDNYNRLYQRQWSQEFRLQSDFGGVFDFNLGAFYYETYRHNDIYFFGNGFQLYAGLTQPEAYVDPNYPPTEDGRTYYLSHSEYRLKSKAAFGELYIRPTDALTFTFGLRYTRDKKSQPNVPLLLFAPGRGLFETGLQEATFNQWTGRAIAEYEINPDSMVYASYARGYKGGGFNPPSLDGSTTTFDPETVDAFEIGTKNMFFNNRLMLNLTGFLYKYNDYQYTVQAGLTTSTRNVNTQLHGIELEAAFRPTDRFTIDLTGGWLKTEILEGDNNLSINPYDITNGDPNLIALKSTSGACVAEVEAVARTVALINAGFVPPSALVGACPTAAAPNGPLAGSLGLVTSFGVPTDITGNELPNSPEWSVSAGAQYEFYLSDSLTMTPRADFHYQTGVEGSVYNEPDNRARGWTNVNATLTFEEEDLGLRFQIWGKNVLNKDAITAVGVNSASLGLTKRLYLLEPRTYGISLSKEF